jgi:hypothetical protein
MEIDEVIYSLKEPFCPEEIATQLRLVLAQVLLSSSFYLNVT